MTKTHKQESGFALTELLLVIVTLALIGAVGYIAWSNMSKQQTAQTSQKQTETKDDTPVSPATDKTADWETFTSKHGFSIKYPAKWELSDQLIESYATIADGAKEHGSHFAISYSPTKNETNEGSGAFTGGNVKVEVSAEPITVNLDTWTKQLNNNFIDDEIQTNYVSKDLKIGNLAAKSVSYEGGMSGNGGYSIYTIAKGVGFQFYVYSEKGSQPPAEALDVIGTFVYK